MLKHFPKIVSVAVFLVLAVYSLAIVANSMTKPLEHDEQMYCTGAVLLAQGIMIYRDFSYIAQVKALLQQARDLVKFIPDTPSATAEIKNEVKKIFKEADQANREILH